MWSERSTLRERYHAFHASGGGAGAGDGAGAGVTGAGARTGAGGGEDGGGAEAQLARSRSRSTDERGMGSERYHETAAYGAHVASIPYSQQYVTTPVFVTVPVGSPPAGLHVPPVAWTEFALIAPVESSS